MIAQKYLIKNIHNYIVNKQPLQTLKIFLIEKSVSESLSHPIMRDEQKIYTIGSNNVHHALTRPFI
jgi:hypothetical protein